MDSIDELKNEIELLKEKVNKLNKARDQLSKDWLDIERGKSILAAAIDNMVLGFILLDDYQNITLKNPAADRIMGRNAGERWTLEDIHGKTTNRFDLSAYDLKREIERCYRDRMPSDAVDINLGGRKIRIFLSPINILKKSITAVGVAMIMEEI